MPAPISSIKLVTATLLICLGTLNFDCFAQTGSRSQDQTEVVRVFTDLVQTDVMVFDKQGRFANGLKKEDFELRIDGKVIPIEFFERITVGANNEEAQISAARGTSSSHPGPIGPVPLDRGRTIFFYVDDLHLRPAGHSATRKLITAFIDNQMNQNDEVAITSASGQIGFLQQLTDNKTVLRAALERMKIRPYSVSDFDRPTMSEYHALLIDRFDRDVTDYFVQETIRQNPGITREIADSMVRNRATSLLQQASHITRSSLATLASLVKSSSKLPGRKLIFFISDGFFLDDRNSDSMDRLRRITSDAARSGVVIYSIDSRGLVATLSDISVAAPFDPSGRLDSANQGELIATQEALNALARDTGGKPIFNTNALDVGLANALKESSVYYLLAWKPIRETKDPTRFRRIEVKLLGKPDLAVRVRRGFFDVDPTPAETVVKNPPPATKTPEAQMREVLGTPFPERGIPIALSLNYVNTAEQKFMLSTSMLISGEFLSFGPDDGKQNASVLLAGSFYNDKGQTGARFQERVTVTSLSGGTMKGSGEDLTYTYPVFLGPGLYHVRVAARDEKSGHSGSAHGWIEIPDLSTHKLTLSSLLIGWQTPTPITNTSSNDQPSSSQVGLSVDHQFKRNSMLRFLFFIYNAARAPGDSLPDVASQVQVIRDNQPIITTSLKKVGTTGVDLDRLPYAADLTLEGLGAGQYVLQVTAIDRIAKTSASQRTRFTIE
ncbi:MAG: VWA domain-containing protein [Pyrinomonadaceae bacterium]